MKSTMECCGMMDIIHTLSSSDYFVMDKEIKTVTATKGTTTLSSGSDISKTSASNTASTSTTAIKLPKTGSLIDDKVLAGLGIFLLAAGVYMVTYKKKRNC